MPHMRGSATATSTMLTATFSDRDAAERAYRSLLDRGYSNDEISVIMSDEARRRHFVKDKEIRTELGSKAAEGGAAGAAVGGTAGAIIGALTAAGAIAIPGLGITIAGPIAAALAGLGVGGAAGGIVGALVGAGIPEERAKIYEIDIKRGLIVIGVIPHSDADADRIEREWRDLHAENIYH